MSHSRSYLSLPFFGWDKLHAECTITEENAANHGVFITITNLLAGGTLNDISSSYVESLPANTKGAICREVTLTGTKAKKFKDVYAIINNQEIKLCIQDDDTEETRKRFPEALSKGGPESKFKILVAPNGIYDIYSKRFHTAIDYSCVFDVALNISFTNKWYRAYVDKIEADANLDIDISISFFETTSTGTFNVVGGKVTIDKSPLILNAN